MGRSHLSLEETRQMFMAVAAAMVESKDRLTQADQAIGDGDHGVGMARGFEAVGQKLAGQSFAALDELLKTIGTALLVSVGGASGAIFGTLFRGGAAGLAGQQTFDSSALARFLADGLNAVQARGGARPGDKTMVDALAPAAALAQDLASQPLDGTLASVAEAARQGMERTRDMIAAKGKARPLGERSLGHPDPGAISIQLILRFMADFVAERTVGSPEAGS